MAADSMRVTSMRGDSADMVYAKGHVVLDSPASDSATSDNGVYDVATHLVTLTGHVVLTHEKSVMRGSKVTVNLLTGLAQMGNSGGRVVAVFTPPSK